MATTTESHPGDKHEIPEYEAHESSTSLKERIKKHYEIASDYYYSLWYETAAMTIWAEVSLSHPDQIAKTPPVGVSTSTTATSKVPRRPKRKRRST